MMNHWKQIEQPFTKEFKSKLMELSRAYDVFSMLNSNDRLLTLPPHIKIEGYEFLAGFGAVDKIEARSKALALLDTFLNKHKNCWKFISLSYDIKNEVENLSSNNNDGLCFPILTVFVPEIIVKVSDGQCYIGGSNHQDVAAFLERLDHIDSFQPKEISPPNIQTRTGKESYLKNFESILDHIQRGDVYELNYCQEFYAEAYHIDPFSLYHQLNSLTESPFSAFIKVGSYFALSSSPERYMLKRGASLYSQPIKGTAKRGLNGEEDELLKQALYSNEKEKAENVMIVDLVRNDLSKVAKKQSVCVEELFGIYTFPQVHQMISTVSCDLKDDLHFNDILRASFPMGSMTGAPKYSAMNLIEKYEDFKRGLYSGAIGYIDSNGDFDLNVVIRSVLYNSDEKYLSFSVGSAVTINAEAISEYNECLLKAKGILKALNIEGLEA